MSKAKDLKKPKNNQVRVDAVVSLLLIKQTISAIENAFEILYPFAGKLNDKEMKRIKRAERFINKLKSKLA